MRHGSLFSGIGGFDLAAQWMGWENVFQVEWDKWCQKVLAKNFPDSLRFGDIVEFNKMLQNGEIITDTEESGINGINGDNKCTEKKNGQRTGEFNSNSQGRDRLGRIDLITGGFPCQPFSHAGKRKGTDDSRYLWPEMLTTIRILKPAFVVGENVAGLVSMENGKTLDRILSDLANEGYTTEQVIIPACAVGAWHRRDRIWILAYTGDYSNRTIGGQEGKTNSISKLNRQAGLSGEPGRTSQDVSDTNGQGSQRYRGLSECGGQWTSWTGSKSIKGIWESEPPVGRVANGIPRKLDRNNGINYETIREELFALWQKDDSTRMGEWEKRFNIQEQKILQFAMLWLLDRINIENKENEWKKNCTTKIQIDNLRTMWIEGIITEASQRWQYEKQQSGEYNNSLSGLPQERTRQNQYLGNIWNEEPNTPRVASGVRDRVNRLKGLGNAIVPQVAFELFKAIELLITTAKKQ